MTESTPGLVERMQSGDLQAFEEFFHTYQRPVYLTALAITRDPFLAEEILQDVFVKAYGSGLGCGLMSRRCPGCSGSAPTCATAGSRVVGHRSSR